ncbi:AAA family ATPase [Salinibius halmophilus]|uniref:AAA family ATPase n=1 Tax=Salinibius halmophilus TaxID=1853216 RepID=UPI0018F41FD1|nr:AAA family ATPase [Salinibius halmophilus]
MGKRKTTPKPTSPATQLTGLASTLGASFENASKFYNASSAAFTIDFEDQWLKTVLGSLEKHDEAPKIKSWLNRFSDVCKELNKYQEALNKEHEERWNLVNEMGANNEELGQLHEEKAQQLKALEDELTEKQNELETEEAELASLKAELTRREKEVKKKELDAKVGFTIENENALKQLEAKQKELVAQHENDLKELREEQHRLDKAIREAKRELETVQHEYTKAEVDRLEALDIRESKLKAEEALVARDKNRVGREWREIKAERDDLENVIAEKMELERQAHEKQVERQKQRLAEVFERLNTTKEQFADLAALQQELGDKAPNELLDELETLKAQNFELRRELDQSDSEGLREEKDYLSKRVNDLENDLATLRPELDAARRELSTKRLSATDLETVECERKVLEHHKNVLKVHIDDLESRVTQLTDAQKAKTAFPAMAKMDQDKAYTAPIELEHVPELNAFAGELQHRIAQAEKHVELFYPLEDIQVLLGGLAMSQLHVFQGISGTGKTSLAKAFAKAMGGFCQDISVQAGWRDRDDLLGHFNAFERKFYEKDCLQALYKAQTTRWQDSCNVILLDEMNLSRPEQYFAEFLSALEKNNPSERLISLAETELPGAPQYLRDGRQILVPNNVWFIGTANHDETTNELADKTYDRSHVMTLPKQDASFDITQLEPKKYSFESLMKAFDKACKDHSKEVKELLAELTRNDFTASLEKDFGLGWGNRFEKQALRFIPVMMATGATKGQALDHLLATRVMRQGKVTSRFDVNKDALESLQLALDSFWQSAKLNNQPTKSLELLEKDILRKEGGF